MLSSLLDAGPLQLHHQMWKTLPKPWQSAKRRTTDSSHGLVHAGLALGAAMLLLPSRGKTYRRAMRHGTPDWVTSVKHVECGEESQRIQSRPVFTILCVLAGQSSAIVGVTDQYAFLVVSLQMKRSRPHRWIHCPAWLAWPRAPCKLS